MAKTVIKIENLSKLYRLGVWGTGTLRDDLAKYFSKLRGKSDPTQTIGSTNTLSEIDQDYIWALRDINLEVKQGEVLGIIGKNGAGKSTLLKILSQITSPTSGSIKMKGRVASLLEVGTGMHGELTGRENIFLNGAILGMQKWEIKRKFDEIVDFSGIAKYVETPIKRYSSGMSVRLGFAIAAFLEPEILIVDEVLAVGDAEFQKKAIGKMQDVSKGEGRTVLFVSHNLNSVRSLCTKSVVLKSGCLNFEGDVNEGISRYLGFLSANETAAVWENDTGNFNQILMKKIWISDEEENIKSTYFNSEVIVVHFTLHSYHDVPNVKLGFDLLKNDEVIFRTQQVDNQVNSNFETNSDYYFKVQIPANFLNEGLYFIRPLLSIHCVADLSPIFKSVISFKISIDGKKNDYHSIINEKNHPGCIFPMLKWSSEVV